MNELDVVLYLESIFISFFYLFISPLPFLLLLLSFDLNNEYFLSISAKREIFLIIKLLLLFEIIHISIQTNKQTNELKRKRE